MIDAEVEFNMMSALETMDSRLSTIRAGSVPTLRKSARYDKFTTICSCVYEHQKGLRYEFKRTSFLDIKRLYTRGDFIPDRTCCRP
mgnify:CR=1 FL=1